MFLQQSKFLFTKRMELFVVVVLLFKIFGESECRPYVRPDKVAVNWLRKYGYISSYAAYPTVEVFQAALKRLQHFAGLTITATYDDATKKLMQRSRCGLSDPWLDMPRSIQLVPLYKDRVRKRRHVFSGDTWEFKDKSNRHLTWSLKNVGKDLTPETVRSIMNKAFGMWSKYTNITFLEIDRKEADIIVSFLSSCHFSDDYYCFDGRGGSLGHAFYPRPGHKISGDIHFDNDEIYVDKKSGGIDLLWLAVHQIGHSLGLDHSNFRGSIMFPWYEELTDLQRDDIAGIEVLYGRSEVVTKPPTTVSTRAPPATPKPETMPAVEIKPETITPDLVEINEGETTVPGNKEENKPPSIPEEEIPGKESTLEPPPMPEESKPEPPPMPKESKAEQPPMPK